MASSRRRAVKWTYLYLQKGKVRHFLLAIVWAKKTLLC